MGLRIEANGGVRAAAAATLVRPRSRPSSPSTKVMAAE